MGLAELLMNRRAMRVYWVQEGSLIKYFQERDKIRPVMPAEFTKLCTIMEFFLCHCKEKEGVQIQNLLTTLFSVIGCTKGQNEDYPLAMTPCIEAELIASLKTVSEEAATSTESLHVAIATLLDLEKMIANKSTQLKSGHARLG